MRKLILSIALASTSLMGTAAYAETMPDLSDMYEVLDQRVQVADESKIEVVELFWYGCPHCNQLEPFITQWSKDLPADVKLVRMPAMFGGVWDLHGQLFLTLEALQVDQSIHEKVFAALHKERRQLKNYDAIEKFVTELGINPEQFKKTWYSFTVKAQMDKARKAAMAYKIQGVPVLIVDGQYRFDIGTAGGLQETIDVANALIAKVRASRK